MTIGTAIQWRTRALVEEARHLPVRFRAWAASRRRLSEYCLLSEAELRATRKSDLVFAFGSGSSLNAIGPAEWREIERHDTIGFNWFVHEPFVRCDYHIVREITRDDLDERTWRGQLEEFERLVKSNPHYARTIFLVQTGFRATNGNRAIGFGALPSQARLYLWRSLKNRREPSESLAEGLVHAHATLVECVNFAFLMGWTRIVLVGVDLYDRQYFWLPPGQPAFGDAFCEAPHNTASTGMIELLGEWRTRLAARGIEMFVHNPRSLLARTIPVWTESVVGASSPRGDRE
jgi:hypothetical protein